MIYIKRLFSTTLSKGNKIDLEITKRAAERLAILSKTQPYPYLKVQIDTGGCHGFQYNIFMAKEAENGDVCYERDGQKVLVDTVTLDMLKGSKLDYTDDNAFFTG